MVIYYIKNANNLPLGLHDYICDRLKHNMTITISQKIGIPYVKIMFHGTTNTKSLKLTHLPPSPFA